MIFDPEKTARAAGKRRIAYLESVGSTSTKLRELIACRAAGCGDVVAAARQTAGRGRHGKSFSSERGGIYFSFAENNRDGALVTVAAGVAVANVLSSYGCDPEIKWVNDVLTGGKKVCGILAEALSGTELCVIGIGINLLSSAIPAELRSVAGALDASLEKLPAPDELVGKTVAEYERLSKLPNGELIEQYKKRLKLLGGKIKRADSGEVLTAIDVSPSGELIAEREDGESVRLNSGEISILPL